MFRFWSSDSRGSAQADHFMPEFSKPLHGVVNLGAKQHALKRKRPSTADVAAPSLPAPSSAKRIKLESRDGLAMAVSPSASRGEVGAPQTTRAAANIHDARDAIQHHFSMEILLKHNELRLVEQELAKCQIALEQLRRCHLIPYPTACPTPQQMLDISSGKGAAVRPRPGEAVPKWAPPYGVVDGPYARHYAKWLIPDPVFDGLLPEWQGVPRLQQPRSAVEGRTTRNSYVDAGALGKQRAGRGAAGPKLQALSSGYPQPKERAGPCTLKRADGQMVKLVCIDCHRDNFSSTQGFINHCRIAHKRDFKSHEEAAVHCGHPIEVDEVALVPAPEEKVAGGLVPGLVHPLARSDKETATALLARIETSAQMFKDGRLTGVHSIPAAPAPKVTQLATTFVGSDKTPFLTRLMRGKNFAGNLHEHVEDAKTPMEVDDDSSFVEDSEDGERTVTPIPPPYLAAMAAVRTPAVMRVPARPTMSPASLATGARPSSSKGHSPHLAFAVPVNPPVTPADASASFEDDEMDADLSPNTVTSNNAPSLVSDDGEYDDSEDGSSSEVCDSEAESVSAISIAEDEAQGHETPRGIIRHHRGSTVAAVRMKKDEPKHVTFVSPVRDNNKGGRRKQKT